VPQPSFGFSLHAMHGDLRDQGSSGVLEPLCVGCLAFVVKLCRCDKTVPFGHRICCQVYTYTGRWKELAGGRVPAERIMPLQGVVWRPLRQNR
jgi:hypothetical protein